MSKNKMKLSVLAGALALVLIAGLVMGAMPAQVSAATSGELKAQINELKGQKTELDAQLKELRGQLSENSSEIEKMVAEKNIIDQEVFLLYQQITNINTQIATYSLLIADKQDELAVAEENYATLLKQNKERIQAMEEEGELSYWSVLFQASSFSDFLDRINMIREIAASDKRRLDALNAAARTVTEAKTELEAEKADLEQTRRSLQDAQTELEEKRKQADALLADLVERGMEYTALVEASEEAQAALMQQIANKESQYDKALYQEWLATSVPPTTKPKPPSQTEPHKPSEPAQTTKPTEPNQSETPDGEEGWIVPIKYTAFTSPFGERDAPTAGASTNHKGVDLAAPEGTPIYASRSGKVTIASHDSSAGYYVQIDHGDGYKSVYMHMTHYTVSVGQYVKQGQVIGYCGSTGVSTGPHLHFGISYNGTYVNPANYIPI